MPLRRQAPVPRLLGPGHNPATKEKFEQEAKLVEDIGDLDELQCGEATDDQDDAAQVLEELNAFLSTAEPARPGGEMALVVPASRKSAKPQREKCVISYSLPPATAPTPATVTRPLATVARPFLSSRLELRRANTAAPRRVNTVNAAAAPSGGRAECAGTNEKSGRSALKALGSNAVNAIYRGVRFATSTRSKPVQTKQSPVDSTALSDGVPILMATATPAQLAEPKPGDHATTTPVKSATCNNPRSASEPMLSGSLVHSENSGTALILDAVTIETPFVETKELTPASSHKAASSEVERELQRSRGLGLPRAAATNSQSKGAVLMNVDSGCSGSLTFRKDLLTNLRPCNERFRAASGAVGVCKQIGDMPILVKLSSGETATAVLRNVRLIPEFQYTLLSVDQLWREQKIDSVFGDTRALVFPNGEKVKFDPGSKLGVIRAFSAIVAGKALQQSRRSSATSAQPQKTASRGPVAPARAASATSAKTSSALAGEQTPAPAPRPLSQIPTIDSGGPQTPPTTAQNGGSALARRLPSVTGATERPVQAAASVGLESTGPSGRATRAPTTSLAVGPADGSPPPLPRASHAPPDARPIRLAPPDSGVPPAAPAAAASPGATAPSPPSTSAGRSSTALGYHQVSASSHIARLPAIQAAEVMHRRCHAGIDKIRAMPHTTDAPKNLASAPAVPPCVECAASTIKKATHSGTLAAPAPEPGS